jgi:hypothetical protein
MLSHTASGERGHGRPGLGPPASAAEAVAGVLREVAIFLTHYAGWPTGAKLSMLTERLIGEDAKARPREQ